MFVLLPSGEETRFPGADVAAWNDDGLGHGGRCHTGQESEGEKREETKKGEKMMVFYLTVGVSVLCPPRDKGRGSHCVLSIQLPH